MNKLLKEKIKDAVRAVLPLTIVVIAVLSILPNDNKLNDITMFSISSVLLMIGLVIFNIGAVHSMMALSKEIGAYVTKKRKIWLLILVGAVLGLLVTISEPSVWVLGGQFEEFVDKYLLIFAISIGLAFFLVIALLRLVFKIKLNIVLLISFGVLFALAGAADLLGAGNFVPVAFDSGGVTTGTMGVSFIIALGLGVLSTCKSKDNDDESFGLVGIASIGPIIAVLILGIAFNKMQPSTTAPQAVLGFTDYVLAYLKDMGIAILPFILFFFIFQIFVFKFPKERVAKIIIGFVMTYLGLVIFLVGANVGFMKIGTYLGEVIAGFDNQWLLIVFGVIFGFVIVAAEPSVLLGQIQEVTDNRISKKVVLTAMSIGVSLAVGLAMVRIVYDISIWYFIVPGYLIPIALSFVVPKLFTGIAFDLGGEISGVLASTFLVPFALGAANVIYPGSPDKLLTNAFGLVSFVAMGPLIAIQVVGLIFKIKKKRIKIEPKNKEEDLNFADPVLNLEVKTLNLDDEVIDLDLREDEIIDLDLREDEITDLYSKEDEIIDLDLKEAEITDLDSKEAEIIDLYLREDEIIDLYLREDEIIDLYLGEDEITDLDSKEAEIIDLDLKEDEIINLDLKETEIINLDLREGEVVELDSKEEIEDKVISLEQEIEVEKEIKTDDRENATLQGDKEELK